MKICLLNENANLIRSTTRAAAFDIVCPIDVNLCPKQSIKISLGFKLLFDEDQAGLFLPRSSANINFCLQNTIGLGDEDYFQEYFAKIVHRGITEEPLVIKKGERFLQLLVLKVEKPELEFLTSEDYEIETSKLNYSRTGGDGSTGKF